MELIITLIIWAVILLSAVYFAQLIIGLVIWVFIGAVWLITLPFKWVYEKIQERRA